MTESDKKKFFEAMGVLRACYPGTYFGSDEDIKRQCRGYWDVLQHNPWELVSRAFLTVTKNHPERMPTAPQIEQECRAIAVRRIEYDRDRQRVMAADAESKAAAAHQAVLPSEPRAQQIYVETAKDAGERLAREFEIESKNLGILPWQATPPEIAKRRFAKIQEVLDGKFNL